MSSASAAASQHSTRGPAWDTRIPPANRRARRRARAREQASVRGAHLRQRLGGVARGLVRHLGRALRGGLNVGRNRRGGLLGRARHAVRLLRRLVGQLLHGADGDLRARARPLSDPWRPRGGRGSHLPRTRGAQGARD